MGKGRIEAFSDGVFAIIITIMVLELHTPDGDSFEALRMILPAFSGYVLSFIYIGIYWNNHHHLLHASKRVDGVVLWANLHLLFWLSLVPFASRWMGDWAFAGATVSVYGTVLWGAGVAYYLLSRALIRLHGDESVIANAIGRDWKGLMSLALYTVSVPLGLAFPLGAVAIYGFVALMWLVPDPRIERAVQ